MNQPVHRRRGSFRFDSGYIPFHRSSTRLIARTKIGFFASPHYHGKTPYTYQILFRRHIRPVIERISGLKSSKQPLIGWHKLRRSLATLLISNGENVKVGQSAHVANTARGSRRSEHSNARKKAGKSAKSGTYSMYLSKNEFISL